MLRFASRRSSPLHSAASGGTWSYGDAVVTTNTGEGREYLEIGLQKDIDGVGDVVVHHVENRISQ